MIDFNRILTIVRGATDTAKTLDRLFDAVVETFGSADQAKLKSAYADARRRTDTAHADLQDKLKDAASRR